VPFCEQHGIAFIAHSPVGGHRGHARVADDPTLKSVAAQMGLSSYQVAIAWLLAKSPILFAIPGASKTSSVSASAHVGNVSLSPEQLELLERAFPPASSLTRTLVSVRSKARHVVRNVRARLR
jgi:diketogulonate reductase-like aldo/keto reductase